MMQDAPFLSVILPVYNEGDALRANIIRALKFLRSSDWTFEVVTVNDGSTDGSLQVLQELARENPELVLVSYDKNAGKGNAIQEGIARTRGKWLVTLDSDLELPIEQIRTFLGVQEASGAQIVIGSKWHPESKIEYPAGRKKLSRGLHLVVRFFFPLRLTDTQVGIKLMEGNSVRFVSHTTLVKRFAWDIEFLLVANLYGLKIAEAPITLIYSREGLGRVKIRTILQIVREVAGIWYRYYIRSFYSRSLANWSRNNGFPARFNSNLQGDAS
ncbi:MAG: glycosyltransferase [Nitrososphaerota archaeon]|nr:glycosyltransferase [Nitrososphaerota archaeon]